MLAGNHARIVRREQLTYVARSVLGPLVSRVDVTYTRHVDVTTPAVIHCGAAAFVVRTDVPELPWQFARQ